jgi:hypothetical protein
VADGTLDELKSAHGERQSLEQIFKNLTTNNN